VNAIVCTTSGVYVPATGIHTDCGSVEGLNQTVQFPAGTVFGLAAANLCTTLGSSGSPVYKNDTGYGLISGYTGSASDCHSVYQGLVAALQTLNVELLP